MGWGVFLKSGPEREGISWNVLAESLKPEEGMSGMGLRSALGTGLAAALEEGCESRIKAKRSGQWLRVSLEMLLEVTVDVVSGWWDVCVSTSQGIHGWYFSVSP